MYIYERPVHGLRGTPPKVKPSLRRRQKPKAMKLDSTTKVCPSGVVGALPLSREARVQFPARELGSHQISPDGARAGNLMRPRIGWGLQSVPDPIQSWRFREVYAGKSRGPSLHRLGKIDAICTCIDTSDVRLKKTSRIAVNSNQHSFIFWINTTSSRDGPFCFSVRLHMHDSVPGISNCDVHESALWSQLSSLSMSHIIANRYSEKDFYSCQGLLTIALALESVHRYIV